MKSIGEFLLCLVSLWVFIGVSLAEERKTSDILLPERGICAHRGAMVTHPENTLPAFEEAIRLGVHMTSLM